MSAVRTRRAAARLRSRSEIVVAAVAAAGILAATVLLVWLLRPGPRFTPGSGGLITRQPRMSWLVVLTAAALGWAGWWLQRGRRRPRRLSLRATLPIGAALIVGAAVGAGAFWPGGVIRHWPSAPRPIGISDVSGTTITTAPGTTAAVPGTTIATAPGTTP